MDSGDQDERLGKFSSIADKNSGVWIRDVQKPTGSDDQLAKPLFLTACGELKKVIVGHHISRHSKRHLFPLNASCVQKIINRIGAPCGCRLDNGGSRRNQFFIALHEDGFLQAWGESRLGCLGLGVNYQNCGTEPRSIKIHPTHMFNGEMGIVCDEKGTVKEVSDNMPADTTGIQVGDTIELVDSYQFSKETLALAENSGSNYFVRFLPCCIEPERSRGRCRIVDIQFGKHHVLSRTEFGMIYAWGENSNGQLGLNDTQNRHEPAFVEELGSLPSSQILAIDNMSYSLNSMGLGSGLVYAWGFNHFGVLALEHDNPRVLKPEPMFTMRHDCVTRLAVKESSNGQNVSKAFIAFLDSVEPFENQQNVNTPNKNFWIWGQWGQREIKVPFLVQKINGKTCDVVIGNSFIIVMDGDGQLLSWGEDASGCLGQGENLTCSEPRKISFPSITQSVTDIHVGKRHLLALTSDGGVFAWGANFFGQLGLNDTQVRYEPTCVETLQPYNVVQVLAIDNSSYALTIDGDVYAWGFNEDGFLALDHDNPRVLKPELMTYLKGAHVSKLAVNECGRRVKLEDNVCVEDVAMRAIVAFVEPGKRVLVLEAMEVDGADMHIPLVQVKCRSVAGEELACLTIDRFMAVSTLQKRIAAELELPTSEAHFILPDGTPLGDTAGEVWAVLGNCPNATRNSCAHEERVPKDIDGAV